MQDSRTIKHLTRLPLWALALGLLAPVWAFYSFSFENLIAGSVGRAVPYAITFLYYAAFLMPGALRRLNWRQALAMLGVAAVCTGASAAISTWPPKVPFPYWLFVWAAVPAMIVGAAEWLFAGPRSGRAVVWVMVLTAGVGFLAPLVEKTLDFTDVFVTIPGVCDSSIGTFLGAEVYWPFLVTLTWIAVPAGLAVARQPGRRGRVAAVGFTAASGIAFVLFFHVLMYSMARRSLLGSGPLGRYSSVSILWSRGRPTDLQAIWVALEQADWSQPEEQDSWDRDYRRACIEAVAQLDPQAAAKQLSGFLRGHPTATLASFSASLLAAHRRDEAAPELMRYALLNDSDCTEALETMKVPTAALAILREAVHIQVAVYGFVPANEDFPIEIHERQRLIRLLGKDAGPNLSDWNSYYDSVADRLPNPLPADVAAETSRVVQAMVAYFKASNRLHGARRQASARGTQQGGAGYARIPPPDWNVRGTAALEQEVHRYVDAVNAMLTSQGFRDAGASTSRPARGK